MNKYRRVFLLLVSVFAAVLAWGKYYDGAQQIRLFYHAMQQTRQQHNLSASLDDPENSLPAPLPVDAYSPVGEIPEAELTIPDLILLGARQEVENGTRYDASYVVISYPGGDVAADRGVCTDVIIRAFRHAGLDLQQLIHEDMQENFHLYPQKWGLKKPDTHIDHRRVPNQMCFFQRYGASLTLEVEENPEQWRWGDVVYWRFTDGRDHCGIISDRTRPDGLPLVIHNAGLAREEDCLCRWEITGHFRYP